MPEMDSKSVARGASPKRSAAATMARATGCSLGPSAAATSRSRSSSLISAPGARRRSVSVGRPSVSVPVLSSATIWTSDSVWSAEPVRNSTPISAALPVPTITETGVARPIAHGHAMMSTLTAATSAYVSAGSGPTASHTPNTTRRDDEHGRHEHGHDAVGERLDGRLRSLRLFHEPHDLREQRVGPDARRLHEQRPGLVHRPADDLGAHALLHRDGLARHHRLVDVARALGDGPVHGDGLARPHADDVAHDDGLDRDLGLNAAADHARSRRAQLDEPLDRLGRAALRLRLEVLAEQDQRDDGRRRLVVHVDRLGRQHLRQERRHERVAVGGRRAERDERVHVGRAVARRRPAGLVEAPARPELHGRAEREHDEPERLHRDERHRRRPCRRGRASGPSRPARAAA